MTFSKPYSPTAIAAHLKSNGIPVKSTSPWEHHQDGEIIIDDKYHVQVGNCYLVICWKVKGGLIEANEVDALHLISKIKELMS
jgi:hypothetical protein